MKKQESNIKIFALTDCHQEARKLCGLFSGIIRKAAQHGKNTLICDGGDLFKGIYDKNLCVNSYLQLRNTLPEAEITIAVGNNDFGFNLDNFNFLVKTAKTFRQANIHVLCANVVDIKTNTTPEWVEPYTILNFDNKKVLVTALCYNPVKVQRYGIKMLDITESFCRLRSVIDTVSPDAFVVINHALLPSSVELFETAKRCNITMDLLIGGHEHAIIEPDIQRRIYYPQAFSRNMFCFDMNMSQKPTTLKLEEIINSKEEPLNSLFVKPLEEFEQKSGLNVPIAKSTLDLVRDYSNPSPLGTFVADQMRAAACTKIAMISTGYMPHALRYEKDKTLTVYNLERAFSADTLLQTVNMRADELKSVLDNSFRIRYKHNHGNTHFLQLSQNVIVVCSPNAQQDAVVRQIIIDGVELLDNFGKALRPEETISCAIDPFIGSGELGFETMRLLSKETLIKNNQLVKIKDLFIEGVKNAEHKYQPGSSYPTFKIIDLDK